MTRHIRTLLLVASLVACTATRPTNVEIAALPHSSADTKTYAVHLHHEPVEGARSHMIVDAHGHPTHIKVIRGLGMGLDEKAIEAMQQSTFHPALENGKAVPVELQVEVNFQIF